MSDNIPSTFLVKNQSEANVGIFKNLNVNWKHQTWVYVLALSLSVCILCTYYIPYENKYYQNIIENTLCHVPPAKLLNDLLLCVILFLHRNLKVKISNIRGVHSDSLGVCNTIRVWKKVKTLLVLISRGVLTHLYTPPTAHHCPICWCK